MSVCQEAVTAGKCCVLGLQSTGAARTAELVAAGGDLEDFVSTAACVWGEGWDLEEFVSTAAGVWGEGWDLEDFVSAAAGVGGEG